MKMNAPKRTRSIAETFHDEPKAGAPEKRAEKAKIVMLNVRVSSDFRDAVKLWSTAHNTNVTQVVLDALKVYTGIDSQDPEVLAKTQVHAADILKVRAQK